MFYPLDKRIKVTYNCYMITLNEKQIQFCEEYVANGFNGSEAYSKAYRNENKNSCAVEAHRMLGDDRVVEKIKEIEGGYRIIGHRVGIDKKMIMAIILKMLNAKKVVFYEGGKIDEVDDYVAMNNAVITYAKLTGDFVSEKKEIKFDEPISKVDVTKMTKEEREAYKAKILAEL